MTDSLNLVMNWMNSLTSGSDYLDTGQASLQGSAGHLHFLFPRDSWDFAESQKGGNSMQEGSI